MNYTELIPGQYYCCVNSLGIKWIILFHELKNNRIVSLGSLANEKRFYSKGNWGDISSSYIFNLATEEEIALLNNKMGIILRHYEIY